MFHAIYARYNRVEASEFDTLEEAKEYLFSGQENGECFGIGIFDDGTETAYIDERTEVCGISKSVLHQQRIEEFNKLGFNFNNIKTT